MKVSKQDQIINPIKMKMPNPTITTPGERAERTTIELKKRVDELSKRLDKMESDIARLQDDFNPVKAQVDGVWRDC